MRSKGGETTFTEVARRSQIVGVAIESIAELGYTQASVRKIADRVGVAMSVVLYHFGNKDDLVAAIVAECYRSVIAIMLPVVESETTAAGKLAAHIRAHAEYISTHRSHQLALTEIASNYRGRDGRRLHEMSMNLAPEQLADLAKLELETIFELGVDSGEFRSLSTASMALAVRSAIGGALLKSTTDPDFDIRAYGEELVTASFSPPRTDNGHNSREEDMAQIAIAAFGSRGDLVPLTDFALRLREAGHDVVMTVTSDLVEEITACGLHTRTVDFELDHELDHELDPNKPLEAAREMLLPKGMLKLGENLLAALADVPADVLLLSPFAELAGHPFAEARGIPSIGVRLQPVSTTAAFPPSLLGAWSGGPAINRAAGHVGTAMFDQIYGNTVAGFRDRLGLPTRSKRALRRQRTNAEWPILHGFSPSVVPRPGDWRPGLEVTGYWWPRRALGWEPPAELTAFLDSGSPPVFLGLGSLILAKSEATRVSELVREALRSVGVRGVIQSGGAGLDVVDDTVITIGTVPHDWLFGKVAAVAHSCGAGTTGAGLRAGLPAIAIPSPGGDQPFWARRLHELGISPATLPRPKLTADRLARAIDTALNEPSHRTHAEQLAAQIAEEDGAAAVVAAVEKLVDRRNPR